MNRIFFILLTLSLSLFISPGKIAADDDCLRASGTPLPVGAVFPADNLFSADAAAAYQGIQAITATINACGGVNGHPVELIYALANNRAETQTALAQLSSQVPLIVGSGAPAVSETLVNASANGDFIYWEVTEPLDERTEWAFSPRPTDAQLGEQAAAFLLNDVSQMLASEAGRDGEPLRLALIHEARPRALAVVDGINAQSDLQPLIVQSYTNQIPDSYRLAVKLREMDINAVLIIAFESDASSFWNDLRQADASIKAWVQIGEETPHYDDCRHYGVTALGAAAPVNEAYRLAQIGDFYTQYQNQYQQLFGTLPDERADLAASGFYLLLRQVLPSIVEEGNDGENFTAANIQAALLNQSEPVIAGLMGEHLVIDPATGANTAVQSLVQQRQEAGFCIISPESVATCTNPLESLPTWRERAVADVAGRCGR